MKFYQVESIKEQEIVYYIIRRMTDFCMLPEESQYLAYRIRTNLSPNTVKRAAFSIMYYCEFLKQKDLRKEEIWQLSFAFQHEHFIEFLNWLKNGNHTDRKGKLPSNRTCNMYLRDVLEFYRYLEQQGTEELKVLSEQENTFITSCGIRKHKMIRRFRGFFREEPSKGDSITAERIGALVAACTNLRDSLLLLLLAETGFRIGEILGIRLEDIDFSSRQIQVQFRSNNKNQARAKNAEYRKALLSPTTFSHLTTYLTQCRKNGYSDYLFVNLEGKQLGQPMKVQSVYAMLKRLEQKTGIASHPHQLRHYFANARYNAGWELLLISKALGHRQLETTRNYLNLEEETLRSASQTYFEQTEALTQISTLIGNGGQE
ncbi:tyrosine-type recombinase/integrase [Zhenpiania hominis]|uniref:Tyrosine-type recombinase/integrase n=1 Tax=Zhenpiania hominis TaxID=2763644 RepID=A0A923NKI2_9FIRM|nr:tyrosine-type recombinase/integrase [Zhenpiania hominis]MBC6679590.1 tyrosine-type recombinase/integrase [Zhenpiania hominis]